MGRDFGSRGIGARGFVPDFDDLDDRTGGEIAIAGLTPSRSLEAGLRGISKAGAKLPLPRRRNFGEGDYVFPDLLRRAAMTIAVRTWKTSGWA